MSTTSHSFTSRKNIMLAGFVAVVLAVVCSMAVLPSSALGAPSALSTTTSGVQPEGPRLGRLSGRRVEALETRADAIAERNASRGLQLRSHGGRVQHYTKTYAIFWLPAGYTFDEHSGSPFYTELISRYLSDIGSSPFYNVATQYRDATAFIGTTSGLADVAFDTTPYPVRSGQVFTMDSDIQAMVAKWIRARNWSYGLHEQFFVYTAAGVLTWHPSLGWSADGAGNGEYCAYHAVFDASSAGLQSYPIIYANMPDQESHEASCAAQAKIGAGKKAATYLLSPNGDVTADSAVSITSHEQFEMITDPELDAWFDAKGGEIGDKCGFRYGSIQSDLGNVTLNGHRYILQGEWSNARIGGRAPGCAWASQFPLHH